jgi:hypothetical protein
MDEFDEPWSEPARRRFEAALGDLVAHLRGHAERVMAMSGRQRETPDLMRSLDALAGAVRAFDDAHLDFTGFTVPLGLLGDDDDLADDLEGEVEIPFSGVVAVLRRNDYLVTDREQLIAAGRAAYLRTWPQDEPDDAAVRVDSVGVALYEMLHAHGDLSPDEVFAQTPGIVPAASTVVFTEVSEPFDPVADDPFRDAAGEPLPPLFRFTDL